MLPRVFLNLFYQLMRPRLFYVGILTVFSAVLGLSIGLVGENILTENTTTAFIGAMGFLAVFALHAITSLFSDHLSLTLYADARALVIERVFKNMQYYRTQLSSAEVLDRFYSDLYRAFDAAAFSLIQVTSQFVLLGIALLFLALSSVQNLIFVIAGGALYYAITLSLRPFLQRSTARGRSFETRLFTFEKNFVEGYDYLKTSGYFKNYLTEFNRTLKLWLKNEKAKYIFSNLNSTLSWGLRYGFVLIVLGSVAYQFGVGPQDLYWVFIAIGATSQLFWCFHNLVQAKPSLDRCELFFECESRILDYFSHSNANSRSFVVQTMGHNVKSADALVQADGLVVNLDPRQLSPHRIGPFHFQWCAQDIVWIHGPSGSGKTTLLRSILGLAPSCAGRVSWLCKEQDIAYVEQEPFFFDNESLAVNLGVASFKELDANAINHLGLESFFARLPEGLNTRIGKEGVLPSKGQRMRLAILRAIHKKPRVLVIDEPSAGLESELAIKSLLFLRNEMANGLFVIAEHRSDIIEALSPTKTCHLKNSYESDFFLRNCQT